MLYSTEDTSLKIEYFYRLSVLDFIENYSRTYIKHNYLTWSYPPHMLKAVVYIFISLYFSCPPYCGIPL